MKYSLTWLPETLELAGLKVAVVPGWETRGHGDIGQIHGVMCHHTAGPKLGNMPSYRTIVEGRSDLPGPLAQLALGRDGTFYVVAAGRCFHAGTGVWREVKNGNAHFIGIEAENTGGGDDLPWPEVQMDAYLRGVAAILKRARCTADFCVGHKEYALPAGRKPDPTFDMNIFRKEVADLIEGRGAVRPTIPVKEADSGGGAPVRETLRRGSAGALVQSIQRAIRYQPEDGVFDGRVEAAVRVFQRSKELVPDGIVGPKTWAVLDKTT